MIIKAQKGRGTKVHLLLDEEYAATTDESFWAENFIPDGTDIDEEKWRELLGEINYKKALNKCGDFLSRRDHSVAELRRKLLRTVDEKSADRAINRYLEAGYLDDEAFCESLVEYLFNTKHYSKAFVKQECFKRGIDREISDRVIANFEIDTVASIVELIKSKYGSKLEQENGREKVKAALMRKGFGYYDIQAAFNRKDNDEI
jgi:regulatory protein